jgi:hypothetical protein
LLKSLLRIVSMRQKGAEGTEMKTILRTHRAASTPATADLVGRFLHTLQTASGKPVSAEAIIETLKLDALDWRYSNGLIAQVPQVESDALGQSILGSDAESVS